MEDKIERYKVHMAREIPVSKKENKAPERNRVYFDLERGI
jgi:hypothetical protein